MVVYCEGVGVQVFKLEVIYNSILECDYSHDELKTCTYHYHPDHASK